MKESIFKRASEIADYDMPTGHCIAQALTEEFGEDVAEDLHDEYHNEYLKRLGVL